MSVSTGELTVAPAGACDLAQIAALHAGCFRERWDADAIALLLANPGAFCLLARRGGESLGFLLARAAGGEGEILSIGVGECWRRRGIARLLLTAALRRLAEAGAGRVFLEVAADNRAALALYAAAGFAEAGRRRGYYGRAEGGTDALVLALSPGGPEP